MRLLVTGSRTWENPETIHRALREVLGEWTDAGLISAADQPVLIHGAARGADSMAAVFWEQRGLPTERHPADWRQYGNRAGAIRNVEMVKSGADLCLAFIRRESAGAMHCAGAAQRAGIPVRTYKEDGQ